VLSMEVESNVYFRTAWFDDKLSPIDVDGTCELIADDRNVLIESRNAAGAAEEATADVDPVEVEVHGRDELGRHRRRGLVDLQALGQGIPVHVEPGHADPGRFQRRDRIAEFAIVGAEPESTVVGAHSAF